MVFLVVAFLDKKGYIVDVVFTKLAITFLLYLYDILSLAKNLSLLNTYKIINNLFTSKDYKIIKMIIMFKNAAHRKSNNPKTFYNTQSKT